MKTNVEVAPRNGEGAKTRRQVLAARLGRLMHRGDGEGASGSAKDGEDEKSGGQRLVRLLLIALVVGIVAFGSLAYYAYGTRTPGKDLSLDAVYSLAAKNQLQSVTLRDEDALIVGKACLSPGPPPPPVRQDLLAELPPAAVSLLASVTARPGRCTDLTEVFHASYPASDVATQQVIEAIRITTGAELFVDKQQLKGVAKLLITFVFPLLLLADLFGLIFIAGDSSLSDIAGFGRLGTKGKKGGGGDSTVTFADLAGADESVTELREVIDYLSNPKRFEAYGATPPKGVLLFGPPGCGKTLTARAVAGESGVPFFAVSGTEFVESLVGVGAARVRDLFRQVRAEAPAIVFIDEIDAVGRRRSGEGSSGGEREQTLNQLLVELDGFEKSSGIVMMGATNRPDMLDPALLRPGRFDRHITMVPPDIQGRREILELHAKGRPLAGDVDLAALAKRTPGFTGADLNSVINEGSLLALRDGPGTPISAKHLSEAIMRVLHGPQRRGQLLTPAERRRLAFHEAGHAVVTAALGRSGDGQRVSIVARGKGLAQSVLSEAGDRALLTASEMNMELTVAMSGVAAEVLALGESSTTVEDDIKRATALAREMVGRYGMSSQLGRVHLLTTTDDYLGADVVFDQVSGNTMALFDAEVTRLITAAERYAGSLLVHYRQQLDIMVDALEQQETLEGRELSQYLDPIRRSAAERTEANSGVAAGLAQDASSGRPTVGG